MFEVIAFGDSALMVEAFNGIAAIMSSDDYLKVVQIGMMIACFIAVGKYLLSQRFEPQIIFTSFVAYSVMFVPRAEVVVLDAYDATATTVANVPIGVAVPASVVSTLGRYFTETFETAFATPLEARLLENGYVDALDTLLKMRALDTGTANSDASVDGDVRKSVLSYLVDCAMFDIHMNSAVKEVTWERINKADSAWGAVRTTFINKDTLTYLPAFGANAADPANGTQRTCQDAWIRINDFFGSTSWNDSIDSYVQSIIGKARIIGTTADDRVQTALTAINLDAGRSQDFMINALMIGMLDRANSMWSSNQGDVSGALIKTQAEQQRNVQWAAEKSMFEKVARPITAFIEVFVIAASPIMGFAVAAFGAMGVLLIGKYLLMMVWVSLWAPTMSICNMYIHSAVTRYLDTFEDFTGMDPLTLSGMETMWLQLQDWVAVGGLLAASTPALTLMLIYGSSVTATHLASRLQTGDNINEKLASPDIMQPAPQIAVQSAYSGTLASGFSRPDISTPSFNVNHGSIQALSSANSARETAQANFTKAAMTGFGLDESTASRTTYSESQGWRVNAEGHKGLNAAFQEAHKITQGLGLSRSERQAAEMGVAAHLAGSAGLGVGFGSGKSGANLGVGASLDSSLSNRYGLSTESAKKVDTAFDKSSNSSSDIGARISEGISADRQQGSSFDYGNLYKRSASTNLSQQASELHARDRAYSETATQSSHVSVGQQLTTPQLINDLRGRYGSDWTKQVGELFKQSFDGDTSKQENLMQSAKGATWYQRGLATRLTEDERTAVAQAAYMFTPDSGMAGKMASLMSPAVPTDSRGMAVVMSPSENKDMLPEYTVPQRGAVVNEVQGATHAVPDDARFAQQRVDSGRERAGWVQNDLGGAKAAVQEHFASQKGKVGSQEKRNDATIEKTSDAARSAQGKINELTHDAIAPSIAAGQLKKNLDRTVDQAGEVLESAAASLLGSETTDRSAKK